MKPCYFDISYRSVRANRILRFNASLKLRLLGEFTFVTVTDFGHDLASDSPYDLFTQRGSGG